MFRSKLYSFIQIFWSIYFVVTIGIIGLFFGYFFSLFFFLLAYITRPFFSYSTKILYLAEYIQCFSIRLLLWIQPWLKLTTNFQNTYGFFDQYKTRKVMFVPNHRSNLDTFLLIALIPGLRGMAKSSLFYNIFFAPFMILVGFVPVKKGSVQGFLKGLQALKNKILLLNRAALVFPETTRCQKGATQLNKFSIAVFEIAKESQALVVPVFIKGTDTTLGRGDLWLNPFKPITLKIFPALEPKNFKNSSELCEHVHQLLAAEQACN